MHTQTAENAYKESDTVAGTGHPKKCLTPWKVDLTGNVVSLICGIYCILDIWILAIHPVWWHGLSKPTCSHGSQGVSAITGLFLAEDCHRWDAG